MRGIFLALGSLLAGTFIFMLGNGLYGTLLSIRIDLEDLGADLAGYVQASYFVGFIIATFAGPRIIGSVGHIRSFTAFAGMGAAGAILSGLFFDPIPICIFRGMGGFAIAGLFMVIESWLNGQTEARWRGRVLSIYMITNYSALGLGQLLLGAYNPLGVEPFALIGMLFALSLIPVALSRAKGPPLPEMSRLSFWRLYQISPMGIIGCLSGGMILGAFYGLFPFVAQNRGGLEVSDVGLLMAVVILFGLFIQWPVGWISDRIDRRYVLVGGLFSVFLSCVGIFLIELLNGPQFLWIFFGLLFAFSFTIYPLSVAQANDHMERRDLVAASAGLLLAYSVGAVVGPLIAGQAVSYLPAGGLIISIAVFAVLTGSFALYRVARRPRDVDFEPEPFVVVPRTTPMAAELDPRGEEPPTADPEAQIIGDSLAQEPDSA